MPSHPYLTDPILRQQAAQDLNWYRRLIHQYRWQLTQNFCTDFMRQHNPERIANTQGLIQGYRLALRSLAIARLVAIREPYYEVKAFTIRNRQGEYLYRTSFYGPDAEQRARALYLSLIARPDRYDAAYLHKIIYTRNDTVYPTEEGHFETPAFARHLEEAYDEQYLIATCGKDDDDDDEQDW